MKGEVAKAAAVRLHRKKRHRVVIQFDEQVVVQGGTVMTEGGERGGRFNDPRLGRFGS